MFARALSVFTLTFLLAACSGEKGGPKGEYECAGATHFYVFNEGVLSACYAGDGSPCGSQAIALINGLDVILGIHAFDDDGKPCDRSEMEVTFDDPTLVEQGTFGDGRPTYTATQDLFDREDRNEPVTTMRVKLGEAAETWQVNAVVDLTGTWEITVDDLLVGDFSLFQAGRTIRWAECAEDDDGPECQAGEVLRDKVTLRGYDGLTLEGAVAPARDRVDGTWTVGSNTGAWHAVKIE